MTETAKLTDSMEKRLHEAKKGRVAQGQGELLAHLAGKRLPAGRAIKAKCYECMGGFVDGRIDCGIAACPLYPWMQKREYRS